LFLYCFLICLRFYSFRAVQAGVDIPVGNGWLVNLDVKKVKIGVDVKLDGTKIGDFNVDPLLFSVGVGYRF